MMQAEQDIVLGGSAPAAASSTASPGQLLAAGRQRLGWSVGDVAAKLRMSVQQVDALEQGNYGRLPTGTFLRGFVRSYAKLVALDPEQVLQALEDTHVDARKPAIVLPTQNIAVSAPGERYASPKTRLLLMGALAIALAGGAAYWWLHIRPDAGRLGDRTAVKSEPVAVPLPVPVAQPVQPASADPAANAAAAPATPEGTLAAQQTAPASPAVPTSGTGAPATASGPTPASAATSAPVPATPPEPQPAALTQTTAPLAPAAGQEKPTVVPKGSGSLKFSFTGECWVEVTEASGKTLLSRRFKAGESETVIGKLPVSVAIGNAPVTKLKYNDVDFDLAPHTRVAVARFTLK